ncbi:synaptotagmin-like protein 3 isoform X1 [Varroa destructor]|uniref:Rab effector Noc2 n=1 Tax=Varroa destructor TaxID=109461 RepID=A0A7M7KLR9_VARDE|nr:synaptotagmin-like protein 3 isoform X1 [Varroa destructor]XP_022668796.1 synaptotagmin-like protein 3 isoform X1 [Varroa destructor]XP_022668797.1 synaptotagmin-like protein 3 isoform X1 [Varroa destructor]XP_022668798.1 synaptotagmin-like protein 3 isoform X1 [Varroa destructor]XP_022668799.1 synaptotagmin-like protein 3 isoform X1 [Varroa destructor]XP_022668800.1 synaptotagmin-like protein 3 isoform X1 [Varroa destructor]XP_022668801.1 synaptotagmin-like protein 3 isoform X1 [Varroa de
MAGKASPGSHIIAPGKLFSSSHKEKNGSAPGGMSRNNTMSSLQQQNILLQKERCPWTCPSDRELALRAKVRSGWSIKTDHTFGMPGPLTDKERSMILEVVQKADRVERMEQERIVRLVTQMEKMKHCCVLGRGSGQCHMCGSPFRLLISNAQRCSVCAQDVCSRCGLNVVILQSGTMQRDVVWLCKICHETREVWKKTGAWFFKGLPGYAFEAIERERRARFNAQNYSQSNPIQMIRYSERYKNHSESSTPGMTPAASQIDIKKTLHVSDSDDSSDDSLGESARQIVEPESAGQANVCVGASPQSVATRHHSASVIEAGLLTGETSSASAGGGGHKRALRSTNSAGSFTSTGTNSESLLNGPTGSTSNLSMSIDSLAHALDSAAAANGVAIQTTSSNEIQGNGSHKKQKMSIYKRIRKSFRNATIGHALSFNYSSSHQMPRIGPREHSAQDQHLDAPNISRRLSTTDDLKYSEL